MNRTLLIGLFAVSMLSAGWTAGGQGSATHLAGEPDHPVVTQEGVALQVAADLSAPRRSMVVQVYLTERGDPVVGVLGVQWGPSVRAGQPPVELPSTDVVLTYEEYASSGALRFRAGAVTAGSIGLDGENGEAVFVELNVRFTEAGPAEDELPSRWRALEGARLWLRAPGSGERGGSGPTDVVPALGVGASGCSDDFSDSESEEDEWAEEDEDEAVLSGCAESDFEDTDTSGDSSGCDDDVGGYDDSDDSSGCDDSVSDGSGGDGPACDGDALASGPGGARRRSPAAVRLFNWLPYALCLVFVRLARRRRSAGWC